MRADWHNPRTWQAVGIVATGLWLTYVAAATGFDPTAPLFDFIFLVPLAGWLAILLVTRILERRRKDRDRPSPP